MIETLQSGSQISHYRIVSKIGEGGMGEIYRARDSKLGRDVAIKVLPAAYSEDGERLRRFEQDRRRTTFPDQLAMESLLKALVVTLFIPLCLSAQDDDNWPSLSYLKSDYKAVSVVAHVRMQQAEITGRVGGYENWKVTAVVVESFKGKLNKGNAVEYFHGAEAGLKREYFDGEKIVFLLSERDPKTKEIRYSVLENSTLPSTPDRVSKLRLIRKQALKSRAGR